jgi:hypothetical protein
MIRMFLVVAGLGVSVTAFAGDADSTPVKQPYHVEPIPALQPYDEQHCLRETGTRIARVDSGDTPCIAANGRVYNNDDITAGGSLTLGDVLRHDPSISFTSGGHR